MSKLTYDADIFAHQFELAWEHFKFHAEQRTRMFHFFLLAVALLLNAFSLLIDDDNKKHQDYAFLILCLGGLLSTFFLSLDVRNTQLLKLSEALLQKMEEDILYSDVTVWRSQIDVGDIRLGILSREALLEKYINSENPCLRMLRWLCVDNIKHKLSIRSIEVIAIMCFWIGAYKMTPPSMTVPLVFFAGPEVNVTTLDLIGLVICLAWSFHAMKTPKRHQKWELAALKALDDAK